MKKWLIALCCVLVAVVVAFVTVQNNSNSQIDRLNTDLGDMSEEYNTLKEKAEKDEKTIADLNQQVETLTGETARLTAENSQLNESLETLTLRLSNSQEKLQGVMYILTDGAEGNIDSLVSPYVKIYEDVPLNSEYFEAVNYVTGHGLMAPLGENVFGAAEKATLGDLASGLYALQGRTGTAEEALAALLLAEQTVTDSLPEEASGEEQTEEAAEETAEAPAEEAETPAEGTAAAEEAAEETAEAPAEAAAEAAEVPAEGTEETAEAPAEGTETTAEAAEETEGAPAGETGETPDAAETPAETAAEAPVEETAETVEAVTEEAGEATEETAEAPAEEAEESAEEPAEAAAEAEKTPEDSATILTGTRFLALINVYCAENGTEVPAFTLAGSEEDEILRGSLAVYLQTLAQSK